MLCNARILRTLPYSVLCHIQKFANLGPETYAKSCLFRHFQTYLSIFNNGSYNNINFLLFTLILHSFQRSLKRHVFWLQWCHFHCSTGSTYSQTLTFQKNCIIYWKPFESLLKMMKNAFYFILKAIFVLKIFKFLSWLLSWEIS